MINLDKIEAIEFGNKIIIVINKEILDLIPDKKFVGHLAIQDNRIIVLGPRIVQALTNKLTPSKMEVVSNI